MKIPFTLKNRPQADLPPPAAFFSRIVCAASGGMAGSVKNKFFTHLAPQDVANIVLAAQIRTL